MTVKTNIGNFGSFKDLEICMRTEGIDTVHVDTCDCWWAENVMGSFTWTLAQLQEHLKQVASLDDNGNYAESKTKQATKTNRKGNHNE